MRITRQDRSSVTDRELHTVMLKARVNKVRDMEHIVIEIIQTCNLSDIRDLMSPEQRILQCLYCGARVKSHQVYGGKDWLCRRTIDGEKYCVVDNERIYKQLFKKFHVKVFKQHLRDLIKNNMIYKGRKGMVKTP